MFAGVVATEGTPHAFTMKCCRTIKTGTVLLSVLRTSLHADSRVCSAAARMAKMLSCRRTPLER